MKKAIGEVTFKEFSDWCIMRGYDGAWHTRLAINCVEALGKVLQITPLFGVKRAREKVWEDIRAEYFNLEMEIEV